MTTKQEQDLKVSVARLEEKAHADRVAFTVYSEHIKEELQDIKNMLRTHLADEETQRLQFAFVVEKMQAHDKKINETEQRCTNEFCEIRSEIRESANTLKNEIKITATKLYEYKVKMRLWEIFQDWKKVPFWTFMALFAIVARDEINLLIESIINKFTGN